MLADRSLAAILDAVAARTAAPGGGSSAAWACALGAGLVAMAASLSMDGPAPGAGGGRMAEIHAAAERSRAAALVLAERDLGSYVPVLEAMRLAPEDPTRPQRLSDALAQASEIPLETARLGAAVAGLALEVATEGNPRLRGDAIAGALLAEAGCRAAGCLARLNLRDVAPGDQRLRELEALLGRAGAARERALAGHGEQAP